MTDLAVAQKLPLPDIPEEYEKRPIVEAFRVVESQLLNRHSREGNIEVGLDRYVVFSNSQKRLGLGIGSSNTLELIDYTTGLTQSFVVRFSDVEGAQTQIDTLQASIDANTAAITTESTVRADADSAFASQITTIETNVADNAAGITTNATTITTLTSANATLITALDARVTTAEGDIGVIEGDIVTANAGIATNLTAIADLDARKAEASELTHLYATLESEAREFEVYCGAGLDEISATGTGSPADRRADAAPSGYSIAYDNDIGSAGRATSNNVLYTTSVWRLREGQELEARVKLRTVGGASASRTYSRIEVLGPNYEFLGYLWAHNISFPATDTDWTEYDLTSQTLISTNTIIGFYPSAQFLRPRLHVNLDPITPAYITGCETFIDYFSIRDVSEREDLQAQVTSEIAARVAGDSAEATARLALEARVTTAEGDIDTAESRLTTAEADIVAEQSARASGDSAIATDVTNLTARVGTAETDIDNAESRLTTAEADIVAEQSARASGDAAEASARQALEARVTTAESDLDTAEADIVTVAATADSNTAAIASGDAAQSARSDALQALVETAESYSASRLPNFDLSMVDSEGKPLGIQPIQQTGSRDQLLSTPDGMQIGTAGQTVNVSFGFPAIPIDDQKKYFITIRHKSSGAAATGLYLRMQELDSALDAGTTHIGLEATSFKTVRTGFVSQVNNGAMPGTSWVEDTYEYTPTAGTKFASFSLYNFGTGVAYEVAFVAVSDNSEPLESRMTSVEAVASSNTTAIADEASARATDTSTLSARIDVTEAPNANLLPDPENAQESWTLAAGVSMEDSAELGRVFSLPSGGQTVSTSERFDVEAGAAYTLTYEAEVGGTGSVYCDVLGFDSGGSFVWDGGQAIATSGGFGTRHKATYASVPAGVVQVYVRVVSNTTAVSKCGRIKFEKGSNATPFSNERSQSSIAASVEEHKAVLVGANGVLSASWGVTIDGDGYVVGIYGYSDGVSGGFAIKGNLIVDGTITATEIEANGITQGETGEAAGPFNLAFQTWTLLKSVEVTTSGGRVKVTGQAEIAALTASGGTLNLPFVRFRLRRDTTDLNDRIVAYGINDRGSPVSFAKDEPAAGTYTYKLEAYFDDSGNSSTRTCTLEDAYIDVEEFKR